MSTYPIRFTQEEFDIFGRISGDLNPIHIDPAFCARTRFGRTVAHGMMLFAVLAATLARREQVPLRIASQELMFPNPTYADTDHVVHVDDMRDGVVASSIATTDGLQTAIATTWVDHRGPTRQRSVDDGSTTFGPLSVGDRASITRRFHASETLELVTLVDDPNPLHRGEDASLSPVLLGGMISCLLGMHLPGPGTNWLKQRYDFVRAVPVDAEVTSHVEIVRLRPDKELVDVVSESSVDGEVVATGASLVLVRDLAEERST